MCITCCNLIFRLLYIHINMTLAARGTQCKNFKWGFVCVSVVKRETRRRYMTWKYFPHTPQYDAIITFGSLNWPIWDVFLSQTHLRLSACWMRTWEFARRDNDDVSQTYKPRKTRTMPHNYIQQTWKRRSRAAVTQTESVVVVGAEQGFVFDGNDGETLTSVGITTKRKTRP